MAAQPYHATSQRSEAAIEHSSRSCQTNGARIDNHHEDSCSCKNESACTGAPKRGCGAITAINLTGHLPTFCGKAARSSTSWGRFTRRRTGANSSRGAASIPPPSASSDQPRGSDAPRLPSISMIDARGRSAQRPRLYTPFCNGPDDVKPPE